MHDGCSMGKFNGVHLNKLLNIQGKGFKELPMMNKHMDNKNQWSFLCYCSDFARVTTASSAI